MKTLAFWRRSLLEFSSVSDSKVPLDDMAASSPEPEEPSDEALRYSRSALATRISAWSGCRRRAGRAAFSAEEETGAERTTKQSTVVIDAARRKTRDLIAAGGGNMVFAVVMAYEEVKIVAGVELRERKRTTNP